MAATEQGTHQVGHDSPTDVAEHQRTFEMFIHFWVYVFGAAVLLLVFLAIFNT